MGNGMERDGREGRARPSERVGRHERRGRRHRTAADGVPRNGGTFKRTGHGAGKGRSRPDMRLWGTYTVLSKRFRFLGCPK